jgi:hypothetical protein
LLYILFLIFKSEYFVFNIYVKINVPIMKIFNFSNFISEKIIKENNGYNTDGNTGGMSTIISPNPSNIPGSLNEGEGYATAGNTGGMGAVVAPTVGSTPGAVWGTGSGSQGSGDIACHLGTYGKYASGGFNPTMSSGKKKKKKKKGRRIKKFSDM